jgi:hypothetical protein
VLAAAIMVVILALLGMGLYGYLHQPVSLSVSPATVVAGDSIIVSAAHLPSNQVGEVELWSQVRRTPFHAGADGTLQVEIFIPRDIGIGGHLVKICWAGACHAQQSLVVLNPVALAAPATSPSPDGTGTPAPTSTATPTSPSSSPVPTPTRTASPTPTHPASPSPVATPAAALSAPASAKILSTFIVSGVHFSAFRGVSIALFDPATSSSNLQTWSTTTSSAGAFARSITLPATALVGNARIEACDTNGICVSAPLKITLL